MKQTVSLVRAHRILVSREYCEKHAAAHEAMLVYDDAKDDVHEEYMILPAKDTACYVPGLADALSKLLDETEKETIAASTCQTPHQRTVHANRARTYLRHIKGIVNHD